MPYESKSELKRLCTLNPLETADRLHELETQLADYKTACEQKQELLYGVQDELMKKTAQTFQWIDEALRLGELNAKNVGKLRKLTDAFTVNMIRAFPEKSHEEVKAEIDRILNTP